MNKNKKEIFFNLLEIYNAEEINRIQFIKKSHKLNFNLNSNFFNIEP